MMERLELFKAPPPRHWLIFAPMLAIALLACNLDFNASQTDSKARAEATERAGTTTLPMAYPLGCPEEDEAGRPLKATLSIKGEKRPRCYYGR